MMFILGMNKKQEEIEQIQRDIDAGLDAFDRRDK